MEYINEKDVNMIIELFGAAGVPLKVRNFVYDQLIDNKPYYGICQAIAIFDDDSVLPLLTRLRSQGISPYCLTEIYGNPPYDDLVELCTNPLMLSKYKFEVKYKDEAICEQVKGLH